MYMKGGGTWDNHLASTCGNLRHAQQRQRRVVQVKDPEGATRWPVCREGQGDPGTPTQRNCARECCELPQIQAAG